jgi:hypothetical protein
MRFDVCPYCGADLHICMNCKFYDEFAHNKCKEPQSEYVSNKEKSNFCEYFVFAEVKDLRYSQSNAKDAKERFRNLFKD